MKLVYSDGYDLNLGEHVFPSIKYKLTRDRALAEGLALRIHDGAVPEADRARHRSRRSDRGQRRQ